MKFKTNLQGSEEAKEDKQSMPKELYEGFIDLIQFEIDKLSLVSSAKFYFYKNGFMNYKKFFKCIYKSCEELKHCLVSYLENAQQDIPEFKIPELGRDFENEIEPFKMLAKMEDVFEEKLLSLIDIAFDNKDWKSFHYLLKKLDTIDHLCCRALAAIENKQDVLALCEQHTSEK